MGPRDHFTRIAPRARGGAVSRAASALLLLGLAATSGCSQTTAASGGDASSGDASSGGGATNSIHSGVEHTCATRIDGSLYCWGNNRYGELGDGTTVGSATPVRVLPDVQWTAVTTGVFHSCGLRRDGTVWCWGRNYAGQLGDGTRVNRSSPVRVGADADWRQIGAGGGHTCGIRRDGSLWCWGGTDYGQSDDGTGTGVPPAEAVLQPERVGAASDWVDVSAHWYEVCGVRGDGSLWCAPDPRLVVDGGTRRMFTRVGTDSDWANVAVGVLARCAVRRDGTLWCWGWLDTPGGGGVEVPEPRRVGDERSWTGVLGGSYEFCGTQRDGSLWCWNRARHSSSDDAGTPGAPPQRIALPPRCTAVSLGADFACMRGDDGSTWCNGDNGSGMLGNGSTGGSLATPRRVTGPLGQP